MSSSQTPAATHGAPQATSRLHSAARTVYSIREVRQVILHLLSRADLARFIRVEKGCVEDVARELYKKITFDRSEAIRRVSSARRGIYSAAVTEIDAHRVKVPLDLLQIPGCRLHFMTHESVLTYNPVTFNFIVPHLRLYFPSLRVIRFGLNSNARAGDTKAGPGWSVFFDPTPSDLEPKYGPNGYLGELGGRIEIYDRYDLEFWLDNNQPLPAIPAPPSCPKGSYTIDHRFDLALVDEEGDPDAVRGWALSLVKGPNIGNLHTLIDFEEIPFSLGATHHHPHRPWSVSAFASFASIASTSLTSLHLLDRDYTPHTRPLPLITFADIPSIVSIVRDDLPNLKELSFGVRDIRGAEVQCKDLLTADSLRDGGTVVNLLVQVGSEHGDRSYKTKLFNIIRMLSALCTAMAKVEVKGAFTCCKAEDQTDYLRYLRRQPARCQSYLATCDFPSLGLKRLRQVLQLSYHANGNPFKAADSSNVSQEKRSTLAWHKALLSAERGTAKLRDATLSTTLAGARLDEISATAPVWERLARAEELLSQLVPLMRQVEKLKGGMNIDGVRKYVEQLREEAKLGAGGGGHR